MNHHQLINNFSCIDESIGRRNKSNWWQTGLRVSSNRSSKEQDMGLWFMQFVMSPASGLLDAKASPLIFIQQLVSWDFSVDFFGQKNMTVFVVIVLVLFRVLDLFRIMGHLNDWKLEIIYNALKKELVFIYLNLIVYYLKNSNTVFNLNLNFILILEIRQILIFVLEFILLFVLFQYNTFRFLSNFSVHIKMNLKNFEVLQIDSFPFRCSSHSQNIQFLQIKDLSLNENIDSFSLIPRCQQCFSLSHQNSKKQFIQLRSLKTLLQNRKSALKLSQEKIGIINQKKKQILRFLKGKYVRRSKYVSFYSLLSDSNKDFLETTEQNQNLFLLACNSNDDCKFQRKRMEQLKKWMKNPDLFQKTFSQQMSNQNLKFIINFKYFLLRSLRQIQIILMKIGLKYMGKNFAKDLFQAKVQFFSNVFYTLASKVDENVQQNKLLTMDLMYEIVKIESNIQSINQYMGSFVKLLEQFSFSQTKTKFNILEGILKFFNFNIERTIVVLRNPQLNYETKYPQLLYQTQFCHINDGQYTFKNQQRPNIISQQKIDEQTTMQTMNGNEYNSSVILKLKQIQNFEGKIIQISKPLSAENKIRLKLRLNSQEHDKISVRISWSSCLESFFIGQKDQFIDILLHIIPDEGENCYIYGFLQKKKLNFRQKDPNKIAKQLKYYNCYLVLEDDIISLQLDQNSSKILLLNETRNRLICQVQIPKRILKVLNVMEFQVQVNIALILYTTIPQVEILA